MRSKGLQSSKAGAQGRGRSKSGKLGKRRSKLRARASLDSDEPSSDKNDNDLIPPRTNGSLYLPSESTESMVLLDIEKGYVGPGSNLSQTRSKEEIKIKRVDSAILPATDSASSSEDYATIMDAIVSAHKSSKIVQEVKSSSSTFSSEIPIFPKMRSISELVQPKLEAKKSETSRNTSLRHDLSPMESKEVNKICNALKTILNHSSRCRVVSNISTKAKGGSRYVVSSKLVGGKVTTTFYNEYRTQDSN